MIMDILTNKGWYKNERRGSESNSTIQSDWWTDSNNQGYDEYEHRDRE